MSMESPVDSNNAKQDEEHDQFRRTPQYTILRQVLPIKKTLSQKEETTESATGE